MKKYLSIILLVLVFSCEDKDEVLKKEAAQDAQANREAANGRVQTGCGANWTMIVPTNRTDYSCKEYAFTNVRVASGGGSVYRSAFTITWRLTNYGDVNFEYRLKTYPAGVWYTLTPGNYVNFTTTFSATGCTQPIESNLDLGYLRIKRNTCIASTASFYSVVELVSADNGNTVSTYPVAGYQVAYAYGICPISCP